MLQMCTSLSMAIINIIIIIISRRDVAVQQEIRGNISGESHDAAHCHAQWALPMMLPIAMIAHDAAGQ